MKSYLMFFCWLTASLVISNASDDTFMAFSAVDLSLSISSSFLKTKRKPNANINPYHVKKARFGGYL